jgi:hypothetical protein
LLQQQQQQCLLSYCAIFWEHNSITKAAALAQLLRGVWEHNSRV